MSQQYVLLRKENDLLNSLIGQSFNQKSKFEAEKILNEIHFKAQSRLISKKALCYIVDNSEIKGVGGSTMKDKNGKIISNLILDQTGIWFAGLFPIVSTALKQVSVKDTGGVNRTVFMRQNGANLFFNTALGAMGVELQVGSGSTPPARTDFTLETAFVSAPENGTFVLGTDGNYNSGLGNLKYAGIITAGGAGTINESVTRSRWRDSAGVTRFFTMFRDIISPGQAFIAAQTIALEYTVQL